jgi:hypothetical protein
MGVLRLAFTEFFAFDRAGGDRRGLSLLLRTGFGCTQAPAISKSAGGA